MGIPDRVSAPRLAVSATLVSAYIEHRRGDMVTLAVYLERGDYESIARVGHNMRGSAPSYGFADLAQIGERLEAAAHERDVMQVREEIAAIEAWAMRAPGGSPSQYESGTFLRESAVRSDLDDSEGGKPR